MKRFFPLLVLLAFAAILTLPPHSQHIASAEIALPAGSPSLSSSEAAPLAGQSADAPASIHHSYVYLNTAISIDRCFLTGATQTFCFQAISYTNDWDYVYYLWQRFPSDWTVTNVYVSGEPYCTNGGTFGEFSWWGMTNEVRIQHVRYHANPTDACSAYYCFTVTSGSPSPGVKYVIVPWYWTSSGYGSPPFYPCSSDGYTPSGQPACDESSMPPAYIDPCPGVYLPLLRR